MVERLDTGARLSNSGARSGQGLCRDLPAVGVIVNHQHAFAREVGPLGGI